MRYGIKNVFYIRFRLQQRTAVLLLYVWQHVWNFDMIFFWLLRSTNGRFLHYFLKGLARQLSFIAYVPVWRSDVAAASVEDFRRKLATVRV